MNMVFEKTRELAEAIMQSEEYVAMKAAEDKAMGNEEASGIMSQYLERKNQLDEIMRVGKPDARLMQQLSEEMHGFQDQLQAIDDIAELTKARGDFDNLINQVNQVLSFIITGKMDNGEEEGGCTGSCATCRGCH